MNNKNPMMLVALSALLLSPVLAANALDAAAIFSASFALPMLLPALLPHRRTHSLTPCAC